MQPIQAATRAAKNAPAMTPIWLYDIHFPTGTVYYTENVESLIWNGNTYITRPISHDRLTAGGKTIAGMQVVVGDINSELADYLRANDVRGSKVVVTMVYAEALSDTVPVFQGTLYIGKREPYIMTGVSVIFDLSSVWARSIQIPTKRFTREEFPNMPRSRTSIG